MTQEGITWTEIVAALEPVVARCEALRDEGEHLTADGRWYQQPDDAKGWKGRGDLALVEAIRLVEVIQPIIRSGELAPDEAPMRAVSTLLDRLVQAQARLEQLIDALQVGRAVGSGAADADAELRELGVKRPDAPAREQLWKAVEDELQHGPAKRWADYHREPPPSIAKRLQTAVLMESKKHRARYGQEGRSRDGKPEHALGFADRPEWEVDHREVARLSRTAEWERFERAQGPSGEPADVDGVLDGSDLPQPASAEEELAHAELLAQMQADVRDDREREYLRLLARGAMKTEAQEAVGLPRSAAQALERRIRRRQPR